MHLTAELRHRISVASLVAAPLCGIAGKGCPAVFGDLFIAGESHDSAVWFVIVHVKLY